MMHKKNLVKNLETENVSVSKGRASIEYQSSQAESKGHSEKCRALLREEEVVLSQEKRRQNF